MIDIKGNALGVRAARLSNFTARSFVFDGVPCASLEGPLQAFKCSDREIQRHICMLQGREAKHSGRAYDSWKLIQVLWWQGVSYRRSQREYQELVTLLYDAAYEQDDRFRADLLAVGLEDICHSIGKTDIRDTVLTEVEMIYQLNRLRIRCLRGRQ